MTSLHLNAARIGFTQDGERRVGPFRDAGKREFVGQVRFWAINWDLLQQERAGTTPWDPMLSQAWVQLLQQLFYGRPVKILHSNKMCLRMPSAFCISIRAVMVLSGHRHHSCKHHSIEAPVNKPVLKLLYSSLPCQSQLWHQEFLQCPSNLCAVQGLLAALARFYARHMLQQGEPQELAAVHAEVDGGVMLAAVADDRLADALRVIEGMGSFFNVRALTSTKPFQRKLAS